MVPNRATHRMTLIVVMLKPKQKTKILFSGNADGETNIHPGERTVIFLNQFSGDILSSSLVSFDFFVFLFFFFACLFFEIKIYSDTHSTIWEDE